MYSFGHRNYKYFFSSQGMQQIDPIFYDVDIVRKYHKHADFKKELDDCYVVYKDLLNMALYANLEKQQKMQVFQVDVTNPKSTYVYVYFYGYRMPALEEDAKKIQLLWIRVMDQVLRQNPKKKYTLIYYHTLAQSSYPFAFINDMYKKLPIHYVAKLQKICVVQPNLMIKSVGLLDFSRKRKILSHRLQFFDTYAEFSLLPWVKRDGVMNTLPSFITFSHNQSDVMKEIEKNKQSIRIKTKDCLTVQLNQHKTNRDGFPLILDLLIKLMKKHQEYLKLQGIFRKNASIEEQQEIINKLEVIGKQSAPSEEQLQKLDCLGYSFACVIKRFFTKLQTPIVPYEIYNKILSTNSLKPQQQAAYIIDILKQLPTLNRVVLIRTMQFLKQFVISEQGQNKMNNYNMSVVFCPCFFRSQKLALEDLMNSGKFAGILNAYFNRYDEIKTMIKQANIGLNISN